MSKYINRRCFIKASALALPASMIAASSFSEAEKKTDEFDLTFITSKTTLMKRSEWTKVKPRVKLMKVSKPYDRLTIHHEGNLVNRNTVKNSVIHDLEGILTAHLENNYGDIGYHFIIDYDGRIWEGRSLKYEGAHVSAQNPTNIGVMLMGNFEKQDTSAKQVASLKKVVGLLSQKFKIKRSRIFGHRDLGSSACPGKNLYKHVKKMRVTKKQNSERNKK